MSKKKSYMDRSNILSEKITLGSVLNYLKSKTMHKLISKEKDPDVKKQLGKLNNAVDNLEKRLKKYGHNVTLPRYDTDDFQIRTGEEK
jgi:hypothetical protein